MREEFIESLPKNSFWAKERRVPGMLLPPSSHSTPGGALGFLRTQFEKDRKVQRRKFQEQSLVLHGFCLLSVCTGPSLLYAGFL